MRLTDKMICYRLMCGSKNIVAERGHIWLHPSHTNLSLIEFLTWPQNSTNLNDANALAMQALNDEAYTLERAIGSHDL